MRKIDLISLFFVFIVSSLVLSMFMNLSNELDELRENLRIEQEMVNQLVSEREQINGGVYD
jgi:hypothetical protein